MFADFMLLGFMSLLLTVSERPIPNICIPTNVAETFLPCRSTGSDYFSEEELKCQRQVVPYKENYETSFKF